MKKTKIIKTVKRIENDVKGLGASIGISSLKKKLV